MYIRRIPTALEWMTYDDDCNVELKIRSCHNDNRFSVTLVNLDNNKEETLEKIHSRDIGKHLYRMYKKIK